jgi:hypothetical protein
MRVRTSHLLPNVAEFIETLHDLFCKHAEALSQAVGGNFMLHLGKDGTWVFVTRGPRFGIYEEPTADVVDCAIGCDQYVLSALLAEEELDLEHLATTRQLMIHGEYEVFEMFLALAEAASPLQTQLRLRMSA